MTPVSRVSVMYPAVPMSPTEVTERADKADRVCSPNKRAVDRIPIFTSSVLSWRIRYSIAEWSRDWRGSSVGGKGRKTR